VYRTIVADPPWDYEQDRKRWPSITHGGKGPALHKPIPYDPMSLAEIEALPVADVAEGDARLFLWATSKHMQEAFAVQTAWGFAYKQTLVWRKTGNPTPFGGSVAPNHAEFLLVGVRGRPRVPARLKSSVIEAPKPVFGHSAKPECFQDAIERVSPGPYLELFARRERIGWDTWGNESANSSGLQLAA
jgi:N6-adenosine-specific RNA methylase IME4